MGAAGELAAAAAAVERGFADGCLGWGAWLLRRVRREGGGGWVPLRELLGRPALKEAVASLPGGAAGVVPALAGALRGSEVVEVSETGECIRRVAPLKDWMSAEAQARTVILDNIPEGQGDEGSVRGLCEPVGAVRCARLGGLPGDAEPPRPHEGPAGRVFNFSPGFHALVEFEEEASALEAPKALTDKSNWRSGLRVRLLVDRKADKMYQRSEDAAERAKATGGGDKKETGGASADGEVGATVQGSEALANEGPAFQKPGRKGRKKKDYASWAAATPTFRNQAVANQGGGADGEGGAARGVAGEVPAASQGLPAPGIAGGGGGAGRGGGRRQPRMPDGTRGFAAGRGRPLAPAPLP